MKYIELFKDTDEIVAGILTGEVLPEVTAESPTYFAEVSLYPDEIVVYGQVYDSVTQEVTDTQTSINSKSLSYLMSTDWYEIRSINGEATPQDILNKRQEARDSIVR